MRVRSGDEERLEELDMTTLEERRHQLDMIQTFKIIGGHDAVEKEHWFSMATNSTVPQNRQQVC
jgi:hypothetical protein